MPATFSRTLRALDVDRSRRRGLELVLAATLIAGWLAWLFLASVAVHEVTDQARLEVEAAAHSVAPQVDGLVVEARMQVGREVKADEVLVELDARAEELALAEGRARAADLRARLDALRAESRAEQESRTARMKASETAVAESRARAAEAEARAELAERQAGVLESLAKDNAASEDALRQARAEATANRAAVDALRLQTTRIEQDRAVDDADRRARLAKLDREAVELEGLITIEGVSISKLEREIELRKVRAPIDGRLGEVSPLHRGTVVRAGERIGAVVPAGSPRAVAFFPVEGVGRIRPGQTARLRLHGFPWTRYGTLEAQVSSLASEPEDGRVRVELGLGDNRGTQIPLEHGITGAAEIEVEKISPAKLVLRAAGELLTTRAAGAGSAVPASARGDPGARRE